MIMAAVMRMLWSINDRTREGVGGVGQTRVMEQPIEGRDGRANDDQDHQHDGQGPHAAT